MTGTNGQAGRSLSYFFAPLGAGAQALAQALKSNSTLVSLGLSQCGLIDMGGAQLALSLAENRWCLFYLCVSYMQLKDFRELCFEYTS